MTTRTNTRLQGRAEEMRGRRTGKKNASQEEEQKAMRMKRRLSERTEGYAREQKPTMKNRRL